MRIQFDRFTLDSDSRQLARDGEPVHLSPKAFDVLCFLAVRRPNAVSKTELYEHVWPGTFVVDANLAVLIGEVRKALDDDPKQPRFIRTVHRFGYAFCCDVIEVAGVPAGRPGAPRHWLVWADRVLVLAEGDNLIGRDPACGIWIDVAGVSRRHARLTVAGHAAAIEDLGSKNGTFVNGAPVTATRTLHDGDQLVLGPIEMRFRAWSEAGSSETVKIARP